MVPFMKYSCAGSQRVLLRWSPGRMNTIRMVSHMSSAIMAIYYQPPLYLHQAPLLSTLPRHCLFINRLFGIEAFLAVRRRCKFVGEVNVCIFYLPVSVPLPGLLPNTNAGSHFRISTGSEEKCFVFVCLLPPLCVKGNCYWCHCCTGGSDSDRLH